LNLRRPFFNDGNPSNGKQHEPAKFDFPAENAQRITKSIQDRGLSIK